MDQDTKRSSPAEAWAWFRFAVVGPLLAAPPQDGELQQALGELAGRMWTHPISGRPTTFGFSTIERWYYAVRDHDDPMARLARTPRKDAGRFDAVGPRLRELLRAQHGEHPGWTYQLHADNLAALCRRDPGLGAAPSYSTVRRYMRSVGLFRSKRRRRRGRTEDSSFVEREVRSFEAEHVNALWHLDFHHGRKKVLTAGGGWVTPILLGILDDCSRLCCHAQWYLDEDTESLVHGFCQALQKRGLPRMLLNDNGGPMISAEFVSGLERLGIVSRRTLSRSPHQNGKQETWFGRVEGRLIPMLEKVADLDLRTLNDATSVWIEEDYNRKVHSELAKSPLERFLEEDDVGRKSAGSEELRDAFRMDVHRSVRRGDATITIDGHRFEVPNHLRNMKRVRVRYARWNFKNVHLVDERTGEAITRIYPVDKHGNADARRRVVQHDLPSPDTATGADDVAPLLREMLEDYAATGLPPAYIPKDEAPRTSNDADQEIAP